MLEGKRVLLIIGGGIAAYKCLDLIRRLRERGASVRAILTRAGAEFVTPLSVAALCEEPVFTALFDLKDESEMGHIRLSREADLVLVAPATADLIAKMAHGHANDLASTALIATDKPVMVAPAMNSRMWAHTATQRNFAQILADGVRAVGPGAGDLACGEVGPGRMAEPAEILAAIEAFFGNAQGPLKGRRALVTAGPTVEAIDPIRYIANRSSGKQGYAVAAALAELGAETTLVSGPTALSPPPGVHVIPVQSARDMLAASTAALPTDIAICVAAVADWRVAEEAAAKLKKNAGAPPPLKLVENPDILAALAARANDRPALVIGFAAETEDVVAHAQAKRLKKGCDWIVANDVSAHNGVMGGDDNRVHLITADKVEDWPAMPKIAVARRLARHIADHFAKA
ncbi:MAG: bifunctional phosphopantothenoylcysteine decarboxylase/phosphopantothenate--cysteine ligase CoaBC [Pseudomonadota bacterium]